MNIPEFVVESNAIEGIYSTNESDIQAHIDFIRLPKLTIKDVEVFVHVVANAPLRSRKGRNVRVGNYYPPMGGRHIRSLLSELLKKVNDNSIHPYLAHVDYELLHPFMDGNGRSGRAIWLWQMFQRDEYHEQGFLHEFYYQALAYSDRA